MKKKYLDCLLDEWAILDSKLLEGLHGEAFNRHRHDTYFKLAFCRGRISWNIYKRNKAGKKMANKWRKSHAGYLITRAVERHVASRQAIFQRKMSAAQKLTQ
ncbi:hypothetical protein AVT15_gp051 [Pseudomonas phage vB_PaeM_PS24]|uniref:Uncharacterized protein n=1 Tax=Pseudomonas phage vB_PaeM_PS24 TaxID=1542092 RepID=A0A0K0L9N1_9CAUD|nr:hypothetical protein AVT15_gp051 [Pseudomonas phage vB_PaeM_PS24]AIW01855.1 hypothetical protein vB_PaeM_PS2400153 [Pseudomonas phage vB_PaeM_PS24]